MKTTNGIHLAAVNGVLNTAVNGTVNGTNEPDTRSADQSAGSSENAENGARSGADTAYEIELDEVRPAAVPVDVEPSGPVQVAEGARRPIIPPHLRVQNLKATARRFGGRAAHVAGFHAVRSPWYGLRAGWYALRGLLRVAGGQLKWWWVPGAYALEQYAATNDQLLEWERVHRQIKATRAWRGMALGAEVLALGIGIPVALATVPAIWWALTSVGAVVGLAHYGRPAGHTLIGTAVVAPRFRKLNSDIVLRAYYAAGLGHPDKSGMQVQFGSPMSRDAGTPALRWSSTSRTARAGRMS